jgi:hypothetical protein
MDINEKFKAEIKTESGLKRILLKGIIDEDTDFESVKKSVGGPLVVNFKGVTSINSCGIRTWVNVMKDLAASPVTYEDCTPLIVRQMNMVPSFLGHAKVASAFVPYVCENCEAETMVPVKAESFSNGNFTVAESMKCTSCNSGEMEMDGNPKQYFAFAK